MTTEVKNQIKDAARDYMTAKGLTQGELAGLAKVNPGYISNIINGKWEVMTGDNKVIPIADKWFVMIAECVGFPVSKGHWELVQTPQFMRMVTELQLAKDTGMTKTLIGDTGSGKTYSIGLFKKQNPLDTYVITINSLMRVGDIIDELSRMMGVPMTGSRAYRLSSIIIKFREMKRAGHKPLLIIDEGENMDSACMKMIKGLYDGISEYVGIVLVGTGQLIDLMERGKKGNKVAWPQFYRRFKGGIKYLNMIDKRFSLFFEKYDLELGLRRLLCEICENYGELRDYMEPALREAFEKGVPLTEEFFRIKYDMRK